MAQIYHLDNFGTNLTANTNAGDTTSPLNSIPSISAPFYLAFDATNINGNYEVLQISSKTATNVLHSALAHPHTTAEEVRMVCPAEEMDTWSAALGAYTTGAWTSFTPTWGAITSGSNTLGNGTLTGYYVQIGKTVIAKYFLKWGSTTSSTGVDWSFTYPVTPVSSTEGKGIGSGNIVDYGTSVNTIVVRGYAGNVIQPQVLNSASTYVINVGVSNTIPQTWAVNDEMSFTVVYEAA